MKGRFLFAIKFFNFVSADIKIQLSHSQLICLDMRKAFDFNLFNRVVSLNQIQCFCFEEQRLNPGEEVKKKKNILTKYQNILRWYTYSIICPFGSQTIKLSPFLLQLSKGIFPSSLSFSHESLRKNLLMSYSFPNRNLNFTDVGRHAGILLHRPRLRG